MILLYTVTAD